MYKSNLQGEYYKSTLSFKITQEKVKLNYDFEFGDLNWD